MSTTGEQDSSDDEFESADEGESISNTTVQLHTLPASDSNKSVTNENSTKQRLSLSPITNDWNNWTVHNAPQVEKSVQNINPIPLQQDSASSLSSSPSKTGGSLSHNGSDEDDQIESSDQQQLRRKKLHKRQFEPNFSNEGIKINTQISRSKERHNEELSPTIGTKHNAKDAHDVLDLLAAQSPTRTVFYLLLFLFFSKRYN